MELNNVTIIGGLVRDPETRQAGSTTITKFRIAVKAQKRNATKEDTNYFNVVTFGQTADVAAKYLKKGSQVLVQGRLEMSEYNDKDGNRRESVEIVADNIQFGSNNRKPAAASDATAPAASTESEALPL